MDGQRSYPEDQESRWYGAERGYDEPEWRGGGEDRYRAEEHRVPEQRGGGIGESRYADLGEPGNGRYAETGRYGTGDALSPEPFETEPYGTGRPRRSDRHASDRLGSGRLPDVDALGSGRLPEVDALGSGRLPDVDALGSGRLPEVDALGSGRLPRVDPLGADRVADVDALGSGRLPEVDPLVGRRAETDPLGGAGTSRSGRNGAAGHGPAVDRGTPPEAVPAVDHDPGTDPGRPAGLTAYPVIQPTRSGPVGSDGGQPTVGPAHPLDQPTGPMPAVMPRLDGPPPADPELIRPAGEGVYRTRRPALAVIYAVLVLIFEVPALRVLFSGVVDDPVSPAHVLSGTFLVCGLPIFAAGLYGLGTGAVSLTEPGRVWLRPPTAYLTVALALFLAAALAAG
ncbi:hypothetical protein [Micromonospora echinofusca]|uniref:Uncharacterized protein n=1 Tax=Micromonospora echinofusca TaxID=47858 RepID=A0ABS3VPM3_MICEH|nr:hypothetical protein [Micromonospora echinofusca]MBO4206329.1 hypothetical protein [Micromonospora echinofusca]